jgi:hypothetical protein
MPVRSKNSSSVCARSVIEMSPGRCADEGGVLTV